jgi:hypothetical protein
MRKRGLAKVKELFWYSDSEPNEVLIAFCHLICLPLALVVEFDNPSIWLVLGGMGAGAFQLWAVVWKGCLKYRLMAVQIATLVAIMTVENLYMEDLLVGSRTGWVIILAFAAWNTIRVFKEKIDRNG